MTTFTIIAEIVTILKTFCHP